LVGKKTKIKKKWMEGESGRKEALALEEVV
jgi:hypothetical protein